LAASADAALAASRYRLKHLIFSIGSVQWDVPKRSREQHCYQRSRVYSLVKSYSHLSTSKINYSRRTQNVRRYFFPDFSSSNGNF
jgi:hypothetical protein